MLFRLFWGASDAALAVLAALPETAVVAAMPTVLDVGATRLTPTTWIGLNNEQPAGLWDQFTRRNMVWRTARQLDEGQYKPIDLAGPAIIWIDISVIDLGHAAGTVGLNPGGMKPQTLVSVIEALTCRWQAIVITGVAPDRDPRGMSELVAIEALNAAFRHG